MRVRILGTAASEGWPGVWCGCSTCRRAREIGGKNLRSRASILVDDLHRVDLPPDLYCQMVRNGLDLSGMKYLFFTHTHDDHFAVDQLQYVVPPFAYSRVNEPLEVFGNSSVIRRVREALGDMSDYPMELRQVRPFEPVEAGGITFTPIPAPHKADEVSLNYVIASDGSAFLYACDTGFYERETWEFLSSVRLDCVVTECTYGFVEPAPGHLCFSEVLEMKDVLLSSGSLRDDGRVIMTHFSHNVGMVHEEIERAAAPHGVEVAFDGMEIVI